MNLRETLEKEFGQVTDREWEFAENHLKKEFGSRNLYPDTKLDILSTNIDFFRRRLADGNSSGGYKGKICETVGN